MSNEIILTGINDKNHIFRPSMSQGTVMLLHNRLQEKDFTVATPEEFVKRFNGTKVINKVCLQIYFFLRFLYP